MRLTVRDHAILDALCHRVRLFATDQIARMWWPESRAAFAAATRRLRELEREGWITRLRVQARPTPPLTAPIAVWQPGHVAPPFDEISRQLGARWTGLTRGVTAVVLGPTAAQQFGVSHGGRLKYDFQATHDLGVAEMYLEFCRQRAVDAARWIGEEQLAAFRRGEKLPDAVLARAPDARPELVLEFGGAYVARRVGEFHHDCEQQLLPYELW